MPMEIFVSCVGDLATVGGSVVVVTPVRSPPGSLDFVLFSARPWGLESFYPGVGRQERDARYLDTYSAGA